MKGKRYFIILLLSLTTFFIHAKSLPDYELLKDNLKLVVFRKTGNFCLYNLSVRGKGKYTPLYDDISLGRTNKFYVYKDNKVYELKKRLGKPVTIEADEDSIKIVYDFDDSFYVTQTLSFTEQTYGTGGPLLKIETIVENTSGVTAEFALKALFDTKLGENRKIPLYTDLRTGIFRETVLEPKFEKDSAVISANSDLACLFLINHSEAKMPDQIYVANWERLQSINWMPKTVQGRLFSTQYSHNDSALLFVWPNEILENGNSLRVTMFIGCYDFLRKNDGNVKEADYENTNTNIPVPQDKTANPKNEKDYQYIQTLLDKILEVESNPDMASDEYIEDLIQQTDNAIQNIQE
ncbi:hypothetical protein E4O03_10040 [Treponema sp. OMZ 792]|uniref:hypothetical protein n=1 Tax=unclassified Treponema TaxID=2638727 RepID=UPI0020A2A0F1|nr:MULTISPECIES: hypothetical protein [unclassified Treponema]UTC74545.1 hypothetical protein E4O03_10040 [Treponema sp. OMZ 792]UTC80940.1 hypothetical protein E4O07_09950 [Treponema sp. OMZ 798]